MNPNNYPDVNEQSLPFGTEALNTFAVLNPDVHSEDGRVLADREWIQARTEALIKLYDSISAVEARQQAQREWLTQVFLRVLNIRDTEEEREAVLLLKQTVRMTHPFDHSWRRSRDQFLKHL